MKQVYAQEPLGTIRGLGPLGEFEISTTMAVHLFNQVIRNIIGILTIVAGIWFIFQFITGGISWLTAGGDKAKIESAQKKITQAIIGLVIIIIAIFIIDLIGSLLGLEILRPGQFIIGIWST